MKKTFLAFLVAQLLFACNNNKNEEKQTSKQETIDVTTESSGEESLTSKDTKFDINTIPISTEAIGDFPFFTAPEGAKYINKPKVKDFDFIVFVTPDSIYEVEGKTFRSHVHKDRDSDVEISGRYLNKSFEDAILNAGGLKVFEGNLTKEQKDKYKELATYAGSNGSLDVWNEVVAMYVIRRNDGNVYIAMEKGGGSSTSIQIVQEKAFKQTIKKITSDDIVKDLNEKGKSILYINFDIDKSDIKPDGKEVVDQIAKALQQDASLKIAIEGHTDNTGDTAHNKKLSDNRANAVMQFLITAGIDKSRLTAKGFGAENPLFANDSEENKAKNRRVELVKL